MPIDHEKSSSKRNKTNTPATLTPYQDEETVESPIEDNDTDFDLAEEVNTTPEPAKKAPVPIYDYSASEVVQIIKAARGLVDGSTGEFHVSDLQDTLRTAGFTGALDGANLRRVFTLARKQLIKEGISEDLAAKRVPSVAVVRKGLGVSSLSSLLEAE